MRADNRGEGGILALLALVSSGDRAKANAKTTGVLVMAGLFGASLLYGEGMLTPAISVLSAVEGISLRAPALDKWVVPLTCVILIGIFLVQKRGTARVGAIFGPMTLLWFITIAGIAIPWIARRPEVLLAVNPVHAVRFFVENKGHGFLVLGSVVLCITGGEALYADMGHFGKKPIRSAWYFIVYPALLINYCGQGALLLERGTAVQSPFYELASGWLLYPVIAVATFATNVASQAHNTRAY
jgi:KUP system potassium uptake protein